MNTYINLLRTIQKNFDNNEFDDTIKKILVTLFDDYYMNRNKYVYCIDNVYKKYDIDRYNFIKKKYGVIKNQNLIFRFNRYSKKSYIIKLLKNYNSDKDESYDSVADMILQKTGIRNYKRYIDNMFMNRKIDRNMFIEIEFGTNKKKFYNKVDNDLMKNSNCLKCICLGDFCENHKFIV